MPDALGPIILAVVGLALGIPSYFTRSRHWPGMIAGFDESRCSDVQGLTTRIGNVGMLMAASCLVAAGGFMVPRLRTATGIVLGIALLAGVFASVSDCIRLTRR